MRITQYTDLMAQYEKPISHACDMEEGRSSSLTAGKPAGFCQSAWDTLSPFCAGAEPRRKKLYDGWMKNPRSAMLSCNDGFRR